MGAEFMDNGKKIAGKPAEDEISHSKQVSDTNEQKPRVIIVSEKQCSDMKDADE